MGLQRGSIAVAILSQIPEKRDGIDGIVSKAVTLLDGLLQHGIDVLTETDEDQDDDDDDEEDEDEPLAADAA